MWGGQSWLPPPLQAARTNSVDSIVEKTAAKLLPASQFALAAVGGYGRRELFPHSDVDLLLLAENEAALAALKEPLSEFLRALWDSGLRVSHSARTIAECCRLHDDNLELHISLLDLRFLCGRRELFDRLAEYLPGLFRREAAALTHRLVERARQRHAKFNNTVYHLEPNIKEAPGGIRDIHLLRWLAALLPNHEAIRDSLQELKPAEEFLAELRCFLHNQAGRDNNLLSFELQDQAARELPSQPLAPEAWMRLYYQHARRVFQSALRAIEYADAQDPGLLRQFRDWRSRLSTPEFTISRERLFLRNPGETLSSPESILHLFSFAAHHAMPLSWDVQRRLRNELETLAQLFRQHPPPWSAWRDLFAQPSTALALQQMQETGLLAAALPEWQAIDSLVVRDFYHRYTVDEHTLIAIETIDNLIARKPGTPPRFEAFALEEDDRIVLRLALLLHDIGKGTERVGCDPGDHVRSGLVAAHAALDRMNAPQLTQQAVLFLIERHLDLSRIMHSRDLEDPATARFLTERIGTQEDLRRLTLLTYADISAVNPAAMSPWRFEQLWRAYSAAAGQLTRELSTDRIHDPSPRANAFLDGLPKRYLRTHTREQIEAHAALHEKSQREGVAVEISREPGAYVMAVVARDVPGLFASLCGALASFGMNIVKAEAASNAAGSVLDLFRFTDPIRTLELNPAEVSRLQWTVECVVRGSIEVADLLKRRRPLPRPAAASSFAPSVRFDNDASDTATLIEFAAPDRPGLLYDLSSAIAAAGCNIEIVLIDTEAHKAFDVFYVTHQGQKLDEPTQHHLKSTLLPR